MGGGKGEGRKGRDGKERGRRRDGTAPNKKLVTGLKKSNVFSTLSKALSTLLTVDKVQFDFVEFVLLVCTGSNMCKG